MILPSCPPARLRRDRRLAPALLVLLLLAGAGSALPGRAEPATPQKRVPAARLLRKIEKSKKHAGKPVRPFDQPAEAQAFFLKKRSPDGASPISAQRYLEAREAMKGMPVYSTASKSFLGGPAGPASPNGSTLGVWQWLGPGNVGGRTRSLLIHPTTPSIMYAGGVAGGVWKSTDSGATWLPLADMMANLAIASLAMTPGQPQTIYAGTGEGFYNADAVRGAGIFKTMDGGTTWTQLAATATSDFYYVSKIVVSPNQPLRLYAATRTGVHRSIDGGTTWSVVRAATTARGFTDLVIRTDSATDVVFAAEGNFEAAKVYRNTDAGGAGTWDVVLADGASMGRTTLALAPSNQDVVYALSASNASGTTEDGLYKVFRSTTGGASGSFTARWTQDGVATKLGNLLLTNPVYANLVACGFGSSNAWYNQGWYDNVIAVDPTNPDVVWAGGIDLFRSSDGGASWGLASFWWFDSPGPSFSHADQHVLAFHPAYDGTSNQVLYVGNDGGLFQTENAFAGTVSTDVCGNSVGSLTWKSLNENYGVTQFYAGAVYPDGLTFFGGTQDNGTVRGTTGGGANAWETISGGDGGYVAVNPTNTQVLYSEYTGLSLQKSTNGGTSWVASTSGITDTGFLFIAPFTMDPSDPQRLWAGGTYPWRTTNGASGWTRAGTAIGGSVSAIAVAPTDANTVLVATSAGTIARSSSALSTTSATTWATAQPRTGYCSSVTFDPADRNIAYATYSTFGGAHVWKSTDAGATWSSIDGTGGSGIPDIPAHSVAVDPADSQRIYVGTDLGVFVSLGGGTTWAVENTGFANVVTEALVVRGSSLYAFTHGRGAFRVALAGPSATGYYAVTPCRLFDTRATEGSQAAAPILAPGEVRTLTIGTRCGLQTGGIRSLAVNQTVTGSTADGELVLYRTEMVTAPVTGSLSYRAGRTRANNGLLELSRNADGTFKVFNRSAGSVHFILDVNGTFQ